MLNKLFFVWHGAHNHTIMSVIYDPSDVTITPELLSAIDMEAREVKGEHYLPQLIDTGCRLQWACLVVDSKASVYAEVVDKEGTLLFPKLGINKSKKPFVPSWSLLLQAMQLRSASIDPAGTEYKFSADSKTQFTSKCSFPIPGEEEFDEELYGKYTEYLDVLDKFLNEDLIHFLCTGTTKDGEYFQETMFKSMWTNQGKDPVKFADYLRKKFDDPDDDSFRRPSRRCIAFMKAKLIDVDWERRRLQKIHTELRQANIDYFAEWEQVANKMPSEERAAAYKAMDLMKTELVESQSTDLPKMVCPFAIFDKSTPPRPITQTDLYNHVEFAGALVSVSFEIEGFRFTKNGVLDTKIVSMHVHVNGTGSKSKSGSGITNKAFAGMALPKPLSEKSKRSSSSSPEPAKQLSEKRKRSSSSSPEPAKCRAIEYGDEVY